MHSELFRRWQESFHQASELELRYYRAVLREARGLEAAPGEDLRRELAEARARTRELLQLLLGACANEAANIRSVQEAHRPLAERRRAQEAP